MSGIPRELTTPEGTDRRIKTASLSIDDHAAESGAIFSMQARFVLPSSADIWLVGESTKSPVKFLMQELISTLGGIDFELWESVTATGGDIITPMCRNRIPGIKKTSSFTVVANPTVTDAVAMLDNAWVPVAANPQSHTGLGGNNADRWVLAPGVKYGIKIHNRTAQDKTVQGRFVWVEPGLL